MESTEKSIFLKFFRNFFCIRRMNSSAASILSEFRWRSGRTDLRLPLERILDRPYSDGHYEQEYFSSGQYCLFRGKISLKKLIF